MTVKIKDLLPVETGSLKRWWDETYAKEDPYGTTGRWYTEERRMLNTVALLPRGRKFKNVLDLGCGEGLLLSRVVERFEHITCVDISEKALERAKRRIGTAKAQFLCENMYAVDFPAERFDLILAVEALDYTDQGLGEVKKWKRWLAPGGLILTSAPNLNEYHPYEMFKGYFLENGLEILAEESVSTKLFLRILINRRMVPFRDFFYSLSMRLTRKYPVLLTKHLALLVAKPA